MSSEQLQKQIEQEAIDGTKVRAESEGDIGWNQGYELGYEAAGEKYAMQWQEAQQLVERYEKALKFILKWEFPPTGQFWDIDKLQPMSYAACYGSNGERDFMRNVANEALTPKTGSDELHK